MSKQKIADLPQEEQEKLISEMKELGIGGVYATYTVEKALAAIAKKKENSNGADESGADEQTPGEGEQNPGDGEQNDENGEQTPGADEQTPDETTTEESSAAADANESDEELPEGLDDDAKAFLNGETDELPENAEEIDEPAADETPDEPETPEPPKRAKKSEGICHICRSKVFNGVCSGCGYKLRG